MGWYPGKNIVETVESVVDGATEVITTTVETVGDVAVAVVDGAVSLGTGTLGLAGTVTTEALDTTQAITVPITEQLDPDQVAGAIMGIASGGGLMGAMSGITAGATADTEAATETVEATEKTPTGLYIAAGLGGLGILALATQPKK